LDGVIHWYGKKLDEQFSKSNEDSRAERLRQVANTKNLILMATTVDSGE
jgi:hypothetical protein